MWSQSRPVLWCGSMYVYNLVQCGVAVLVEPSYQGQVPQVPGMANLRVNRKPSSHRPPSVYDLRFDVNRKPHVNQ